MLNIKQKWDIEAKLGEMLREAEKPEINPDEVFAERLMELIEDYQITKADAAEIASLAKQ